MVGLGALSGFVGGLAGVGGSIIMLPALALLFVGPPGDNRQHLFIAAAMCVNTVIALASWLQHRREGAVDARVARALIPTMALGVCLGVLIANRFDGTVPKIALIVFLLAYCLSLIVAAIRKLPDPTPSETHATPWLTGSIGGITGLAAGFLGIGGGIIMVPLLTRLARVPLKRAIATSAAVMWISSAIGATLKVSTIGSPPLSLDPAQALTLAAFLAVGAQIGATLGAWVTHRLNLRWLRIALATTLGLAALRMLSNVL